jgi:hypothetical protein
VATVLLCAVCQVILYTQEDVTEHVQQLTGGKGVKVAFDGGAHSLLLPFHGSGQRYQYPISSLAWVMGLRYPCQGGPG